MNQNAVNEANMRVSLNPANGDDLAVLPASATITLTDGGSNIANISVQVLNAYGEAVLRPVPILVYLSTSALGVGTDETASTGLAVATGQLLHALIAKSTLLVQTLATGIATLTDTDTGLTMNYVCVTLPNGRTITKLLTATELNAAA
jgi:hypothetical protein